jgi:hypothetical protein
MDPSAATLARLRTQLAGLPALLEGVPRENFDQRVGAKWSVTENVAHLARYHEVFLERIHRILIEDQPVITAYRAETDPEWPAWQPRSFEEAKQRLHASREALIPILQALTGDQWRRVGRHARYGALSLRGWLELFLVHEGHHLYVLTRRARGLV